MPFQFCFTFANFRKDFNMKHTTFRYKIFFRTKRKISNKTPSRLLGIEPGVGSSDEVSCRLLCWNFVHSGLFWPFGVFLTYPPPFWTNLYYLAIFYVLGILTLQIFLFFLAFFPFGQFRLLEIFDLLGNFDLILKFYFVWPFETFWVICGILGVLDL